MEKLAITHVILFAKKWYDWSGDIWDSLRKCLTCDGYSGDLFTKHDIIQKLLAEVELLGKPISISSFYWEIREDRCWTYGYVTKNNSNSYTNEYDLDLAVIYWALSKLYCVDPDKWVVKKPDFENCLPINKNTSIEAVEKMFKNC
jgi:hypothetical protein